MYEINILVIAQTVKKRAVMIIHKLVPAHVWDNKVRLVYLVNIAANKTKTLAFLKLIAFLEKKLHSKAYSKERLYFSLLLDSVDKTAKTEHIHCPWERSHAGEDNCVGFFDIFFFVCELVLKTKIVQSVFYREYIACTVVDYCYHLKHSFGG